jgi:hypothetical protein
MAARARSRLTACCGGTSRATCLPCRVMTISSPRSTWSSSWPSLFFASKAPLRAYSCPSISEPSLIWLKRPPSSSGSCCSKPPARDHLAAFPAEAGIHLGSGYRLFSRIRGRCQRHWSRVVITPPALSAGHAVCLKELPTAIFTPSPAALSTRLWPPGHVERFG